MNTKLLRSDSPASMLRRNFAIADPVRNDNAKCIAPCIKAGMSAKVRKWQVESTLIFLSLFF